MFIQHLDQQPRVLYDEWMSRATQNGPDIEADLQATGISMKGCARKIDYGDYTVYKPLDAIAIPSCTNRSETSSFRWESNVV